MDEARGVCVWGGCDLEVSEHHLCLDIEHLAVGPDVGGGLIEVSVALLHRYSWSFQQVLHLITDGPRVLSWHLRLGSTQLRGGGVRGLHEPNGGNR